MSFTINEAFIVLHHRNMFETHDTDQSYSFGKAFAGKLWLSVGLKPESHLLLGDHVPRTAGIRTRVFVDVEAARVLQRLGHQARLEAPSLSSQVRVIRV